MSLAPKTFARQTLQRSWPLLALLIALPGHAVERHYTGVAYAPDTGQVRYREDHWLYVEQGVQTRLVLYRCPSGQAFAKKTMHYGQTPWAPEFDLHDRRDGYAEGAKRSPGGWEVYRQQNADSRKETATLPERPRTVVDAGFDDYVQSQWSTLRGQGELAAAFLMPGRLAYVNVKLKPQGQVMHEGVAVQRLRMSLDGWLGAIAPTVTLLYSESDHRLLEFAGISNIRDGKGKQQQVRIAFSTRDEAVPTAAQIQAAQSETLVDRCPAE